MSSKPIADYGLLSDCRSAALVARDGSIDWWAPRRFDRPSILRGCSTMTPATGALGIGPNPGGHDLGSDVPHALLRTLECRSGSIDVELVFEPRTRIRHRRTDAAAA